METSKISLPELLAQFQVSDWWWRTDKHQSFSEGSSGDGLAEDVRLEIMIKCTFWGMLARISPPPIYFPVRWFSISKKGVMGPYWEVQYLSKGIRNGGGG